MVSQSADDWTATHGGAGFHADGLSFSPDGKTLYAAIRSSSVTSPSVTGYDIASGNITFNAPVSGSDGTALGFGTLAGNIFANTNDGNLWEVNLATGAQTLIATGGSRGDFVAVDPNGSLLLAQTDSVLRLTPGPGGSFTTPEPSSLVLAGLAASCVGLVHALRRRRAVS